MKPESIHLTDWQRMFVGEVPAEFFIELLIRAAVIYLLLLVSMRYMGKRMSSQLGRNELAAMVSLAAAIGIPIQSPDRGILPAVIVALVVVFTERWIASKTYENQSFEKLSQGNIDILIKDAVIDFDVVKKVGLSRERLLAQLRGLGIKHIGTVERFYMEANGSFTLIKSKQPKPGLSVIPVWDKDFEGRLQKSQDILTCEICGHTEKLPFDTNMACSNCGKEQWIKAVI